MSSKLVGCRTGSSAGFTRENLADVNSAMAVLLGNAGAITHQATGCGEFAPVIHRRDGVRRCEGEKFFAPGDEKGSHRHKQRAGARIDERGKGGVEVTFGGGMHDEDLEPEGIGGHLRVPGV